MALQAYMVDLMVRGPPRGYLSKQTKIILIVSLWNVLRVEAYFWGIGVRVVTGRHYF